MEVERKQKKDRQIDVEKDLRKRGAKKRIHREEGGEKDDEIWKRERLGNDDGF